MKSYSKSYSEAGVDITAGYEAVRLMSKHVARTRTAGVIGGIGGFGGAFAPDLKGIANPVLVSGADGVGTKLKIAFLMDKHDTVGIDCVAMCVNDIICCGAKPLFFLDYIALGKNVPEKVAAIVSGVAEGCVRAGAALLGGETAEMPGFYPENEYDLAGFAVGLADKNDMIDGRKIKKGDAIIAMPSSGVHSNGFSLVRKVFDVEKISVPLGNALLTPTEIYVKPALELIKSVEVRAFAHITGGGFYENIPRIFPADTKLSVKIERAAVRVLPIFDALAKQGNIDEREMFNTFNMGVGMVAVVSPGETDAAVRVLKQNGVDGYVIGKITEGDGGIEICR